MRAFFAIATLTFVLLLQTGTSHAQDSRSTASVRELAELRTDQMEEMLLSIDGIIIRYAPSNPATQSNFDRKMPDAIKRCERVIGEHIRKQDSLWRKVSLLHQTPPKNDRQLVRRQLQSAKLVNSISEEYSAANSAVSSCVKRYGALAEFQFTLKKGSLAQEFTTVPDRASAVAFTEFIADSLQNLAIENRKRVGTFASDLSDTLAEADYSNPNNQREQRQTVVLKSSPGMFSVVGRTVYGPEGIYSTVGNVTYGPRGIYTTMGNITYQPDGSTCSHLNGLATCN